MLNIISVSFENASFVNKIKSSLRKILKNDVDLNDISNPLLISQLIRTMKLHFFVFLRMITLFRWNKKIIGQEKMLHRDEET